MDIRRRPGFIERLPSPQEVTQTMLPEALAEQIAEVKFEIDFILSKLGEQDRAEEPWESDEAIRKVDELKTQSAEVLKDAKKIGS